MITAHHGDGDAWLWPLLTTLALHTVLMAVLFVDWGSRAPLVQPIRPTFIRAALMVEEKPSPLEPASAVEPNSASALKPDTAPEFSVPTPSETTVDDAVMLEVTVDDEIIDELVVDTAVIEPIVEPIVIDGMTTPKESVDGDKEAELTYSYINLIASRIQQQWSRPPNARNDMTVVLLIQLIPTGEVVAVHVLESSGYPAFDRSAENAVLRVGRFSELQQLPARVFEQDFRQLRLRFKPEDLRL